MKDAINEKKLIEYAKKYDLAKKLSEKYMFDTDFIKEIVEKLTKKGVLTIDINDSQIYNQETENYTPQFAMYLWRELALPAIGITYDEYVALQALLKIKIK